MKVLVEPLEGMEQRSQPGHRSLPPPLEGCHASAFTFAASPNCSPQSQFFSPLSFSPGRKPPPRSIGGGAAGKKPKVAPSGAQPKRSCMCSPTTHPGSFRCSLHRRSSSFSFPYSKLNSSRSATANSLEGREWVKRALTALIRPSSHQMRRRMSFQPQPSRLRHMITAEDLSPSG